MVEASVIIFILSMRIGEDNENIRRRSKDVKNGYKIRCNKKQQELNEEFDPGSG